MNRMSKRYQQNDLKIRRSHYYRHKKRKNMNKQTKQINTHKHRITSKIQIANNSYETRRIVEGELKTKIFFLLSLKTTYQPATLRLNPGRIH